MSRKILLIGAVVVGLAAGCGRGNYDQKVDDAIRRAKNPPAEEAKDDAAKAGGAAQDGAEANDGAAAKDGAPAQN